MFEFIYEYATTSVRLQDRNLSGCSAVFGRVPLYHRNYSELEVVNEYVHPGRTVELTNFEKEVTRLVRLGSEAFGKLRSIIMYLLAYGTETWLELTQRAIETNITDIAWRIAQSKWQWAGHVITSAWDRNVSRPPTRSDESSTGPLIVEILGGGLRLFAEMMKMKVIQVLRASSIANLLKLTMLVCVDAAKQVRYCLSRSSHVLAV